ncbi:Flp family type IVb pilin [Haloechinothrix halophila]|uniref:Flp family type IVb pilin n=1 Tax=Haloechinothrix halophila TaxID=1069073 RepID=UPI000408D734|nr:Flp family type IVb pilin [Haloechinothrix halophila]
MLYYISLLQSFLSKPLEKDRDKGATAVEYGLMVAAIAAVIVGVVVILGGQINAAFQTVVDALP